MIHIDNRVTIKIFDILWQTKGAGPSPDNNRRTEIYFAGCKMAKNGNPCPGCFNPDLWDDSSCIPRLPSEIFDVINKTNVPKYITIVGGEPTDQLSGLIELAKLLKNNKYHIMLFTRREKQWILNHISNEDIKLFDIIVTGPYKKECRIYDSSKDDGIHNVIGSANQTIWLTRNDTTYLAGDVSQLILKKNGKLEVVENADDGSSRSFKKAI